MDKKFTSNILDVYNQPPRAPLSILSISLSIAVLICSTGFVALGQLSAGVKTDLGPYPEGQAPPLPSAGGKLNDPTFGTEIMRVTDELDGANFGTAYSYWPTFNANSTRLIVHGGAEYVYLYQFDPSQFQLGQKESIIYPPGVGITSMEDAVWSAIDPDALFVHRGTSIYGFNARSRTYSLVGDMSSNFPPGSYLWQMSVSRNSDVFAFTVRNPDYSIAGYAVFQASANSVIYSKNVSTLDEVQIDKSGRYLIVKTGLQGAGLIEVKIVDVQTQVVTDLTDNQPDFAPGHSDNGSGTVIGSDNWQNTITFRNLATPHVSRPIISFGNNWDIAFHLSMLSDNEAWTMVSFYGPVASGTFERELVMVATDGSQGVRRFAHHYSRYITYDDSPRANISRDGRFVAFTSNWGGRGRRDLFIAKAPTDAAAPSPSPTPNPEATTPSPSPSPSPTITGSARPTPVPTGSPNVDWRNVQSTTSVKGTVQYSGTNFFGMARSIQILSKSSYFEWTYNATNSWICAGLGNNYDDMPNTATKDLPFAVDNSSIRELGIYKADVSLRDGDKIRIEITAKGSVIYNVNGVTVYRSRARASGFYYLVFKSQEGIGNRIGEATFGGINYGV